MPSSMLQGVQLWCLGVACLLVSATSMPAADTLRPVADVLGVGGLLVTGIGARHLAD